MPTMGVRIVYDGNNSRFGHMYIVLKGDDGSIQVFGHYPGGVKTEDIERERPGAKFPADVARDYPISQSAFDQALQAARQAQANAGDWSKQWGFYDPFSNSCVDFAWWMLGKAGLTDAKNQFEGYFWPEDNKSPLDDNYFNYLRRPEFNKEGRGRGISPTVNTATTGALTWQPPRMGGRGCPLILDLDGGGISNSGIAPGLPILFDHDGDGLRNATGWVGAGEAIVVRDLNGNGTIDSGRELFGDNTLLTRGPRAGQRAANGFEALADLDSNNDGQFNAADAAFASVKLWKDANQNGISEAGELFTFAQLGVQGIKGNRGQIPINSHGSPIRSVMTPVCRA